jgi:ABC-2 type transport system permease protein
MSDPIGGLAVPFRRSPGIEAVTLIRRAWRLSLRNVEGLLVAVALPVILMLMFVYLFGGAIRTGGDYVDYVVPGVILVALGFGAGTTAVTVAADLGGGIVDRLHAIDVRGDALVNGHVVASVARNVVSTALVIAVAFAVGFRPDASVAEWLAAAGILAAFALALSWVAAAIGTMAASPEAASGLTFAISFLPYLSSAFVPITTMPSWLQGVARNQPVTPVVDAVRALLLGGPVAANALRALAWSMGLAVLGALVARVQFRRRTA